MSLTQFHRIALATSLLGLLLLFVDFGFWHSENAQQYFDYGYFFVLAIGVVSTVLRYAADTKRFKKRALIFDILTVLLTLYLFYLRFIKGFDSYYGLANTLIAKTVWVKFAIIFTLIREFSELKIVFKRTILNPAQLFILSFLAIIIFGAFLLE